MKEVFIGNYGLEQVGQKMIATGWVANIRNHGKLAFIELFNLQNRNSLPIKH